MTSRDFVRELQIIIHVYVLFLLRIRRDICEEKTLKKIIANLFFAVAVNKQN